MEHPIFTILFCDARKSYGVQFMKTASIFTPYCLISTSPRYLVISSKFSPNLSTVLCGLRCVRDKPILFTGDVPLEDTDDHIDGNACNFHEIADQCHRFSSYQVALRPLQSVKKCVQILNTRDQLMGFARNPRKHNQTQYCIAS